MTKTEHYQLNQWEKTDRILREDFNEDNRKIEAALCSVPYTKILHVKTETAQQTVDLQVADLKLVQYASVQLYCSIPCQGVTVNLRVNHLTENVYCRSYCDTSESHFSESAAWDKLAQWTAADDRTPSVNLLFHPPAAGASIVCQFCYAMVNTNNYTYFNYIAGTQTVTWDTLKSFNISCENNVLIPAGSEIVLYGIKK